MKSILKFMVLVLLVTPSGMLFSKSDITYAITGRLGDSLLNYCKHKWIAQKYDLNLYVPKFRYKSCFMLSKIENGSEGISKVKRRVKLKNDKEIDLSMQNCVYMSSYYTVCDNVPRDECVDFFYKKSIEDKEFGQSVREGLALVEKPNLRVQFPVDMVSVAVHIRKGCNIDFPLFSKQYQTDAVVLPASKTYSDQHHSLKFPPEQFYAEQLEKLYQYLGKKPLYVFIFTDDAYPQAIVDRMLTYFDNRCGDIIIETKKSNTVDSQCLIEDIYAMSKSDYLIRSESHFPWIAQMIGRHKGIIHPVSFTWETQYLKITKAVMDIPFHSQRCVESVEM